MSEAAAVRRRVMVRGRVQGVFFRDSVRREAQSRGVKGWIENRRDGAVEAVFEGSVEAVEALVRFCERGPREAAVERIEVVDEDPDGLTGFEAR